MITSINSRMFKVPKLPPPLDLIVFRKQRRRAGGGILSLFSDFCICHPPNKPKPWVNGKVPNDLVCGVN